MDSLLDILLLDNLAGTNADFCDVSRRKKRRCQRVNNVHIGVDQILPLLPLRRHFATWRTTRRAASLSDQNREIPLDRRYIERWRGSVRSYLQVVSTVRVVLADRFSRSRRFCSPPALLRISSESSLLRHNERYHDSRRAPRGNVISRRSPAIVGLSMSATTDCWRA